MRSVSRGAVQLNMLDVLTYSELKVGDNIMRLIVDTGSSTLAVPSDVCEKCVLRCANCGYRTPATRKALPCASPQCIPSQPACNPESNTSTCTFSVMYADGTGEFGDIIEETVEWGAFQTSAFIGRIKVQSPGDSFSRLGVDGIVGIGGKRLNFGSMHTPTVLDEIIAGYKLPDVFCMRIGEQGGVGGGAMDIGEIDSSKYEGNLSFTPMQAELWYIVVPEAMSIGGHIVASTSSDFGRMSIVDSGTTFTFIPSRIYDNIKSVLQTQYPHLPHVGSPGSDDSDTIFNVGQCFTNIELSAFPVLKVRFVGGGVAVIPPQNYFTIADSAGDAFYCLGFAPSGGNDYSISESQSIFGDSFMSALYVVFDRQNNRLGWANTKAATAHITPSSDPNSEFHNIGGTSLWDMAPPILILILVVAVCSWILNRNGSKKAKYQSDHGEEHCKSLSPTEGKRRSQYGAV